MANTDIEAKVDQLAEVLVFAEPSDLPALADIHTRLEAVSAWMAEQGFARAEQNGKAAAGLVEQMVMGDVADPAAALLLVGRVVSGLQRIVRDRCPEDQVDFPMALGGEDAGASAEDSGEASSRGTMPTIPSYVDEAIFSDFLARQDGVLEEMEEMILRLERERSEASVAELKRQIHTLKGESAMLGLNDVERLCHAVEDGIISTEPGGMVDILFGVKDWLKRAFDGYSGKGVPPGAPAELFAQISARLAPAVPQAAPKEKAATEEVKAVEEAGAVEEVGGLRFEAKPLGGDRELLNDFVIEANEHLENCDVHLLTLETDPEDQDGVNAVFRAFHTIKGVAGFLALEEIQALSHEAENLLDQTRKGEVVLQGPVMDVVFDAVDSLKRCVHHVSQALATGGLLEPVPGTPALVVRLRAVTQKKEAAKTSKSGVQAKEAPRLGDMLLNSAVVTEAGLKRALEQQAKPPESKKIGEILVENNVVSSRRVEMALDVQSRTDPRKPVGEILVSLGAVASEDVERAAAKQSEPAQAPKLGEVLVRDGEADVREVAQALRAQRDASAGVVQVREAVKVDSDRLDLLVNMIGELVIAESMAVQSPVLKSLLTTELGRHFSQLDKITRELQVMAMSLRMVPVRSTFQKMARLVRDLSKKTGKQVNFTMAGEDTELDKTVVDKIGDPLVHMVRNAVDHGLEDSSETRRAAGKDPVGNVCLRAFHMGGTIHIQVEDDGRGLNRDAILRKARERGLIAEGDNLGDREIYNLIFEPGFSTAQQVTEVSGRGVGMDVVKRNIEALRGQVDIQSEAGKGSVFTIRLPLTLAIIDGMVVRVGLERYIIPTLSIVISLRPDKQDINTVVGRGEILTLQGHLVPIVRLYKLFGLEGALTECTDGTIVVVENAGGRVGLLVDEILGQQQTVIKSLGEVFKDADGVAGGAIMPDGRVGLILDVGGLIKLSENVVQ